MGNVAAQLRATFERAHTRLVAVEITKRWPARGSSGINYMWVNGDTGDHAAGKATDFMTLVDDQSRLQVAMGTAIANYLWSNRQRLGVHYVIYRQRIISVRDNSYGPAGVWHPMEDRGNPTKNHMDHVHATYLDRPPAYKPPSITGADDMPTPAEYAAEVRKILQPTLNELERYAKDAYGDTTAKLNDFNARELARDKAQNDVIAANRAVLDEIRELVSAVKTQAPPA